MSAFLSIAGVSKRFRGLVAMDRVACEVAKGESIANSAMALPDGIWRSMVARRFRLERRP